MSGYLLNAPRIIDLKGPDSKTSRSGLVWFYVISTIVGNLMPNPFLCIWTVLFQPI